MPFKCPKVLYKYIKKCHNESYKCGIHQFKQSTANGDIHQSQAEIKMQRSENEKSNTNLACTSPKEKYERVKSESFENILK
jgi:hypothetical protein